MNTKNESSQSLIPVNVVNPPVIHVNEDVQAYLDAKFEEYEAAEQKKKSSKKEKKVEESSANTKKANDKFILNRLKIKRNK